MIRLNAGASSLVGQVRSANEDSFLLADDLAAVADGMGGHNAGEVASALTVDVLSTTAGHRSLADLVLAVHRANRSITEQAADDESLRGMGTTVCVVGVVDEDGEHLAVLNVGDSRVYLFADGELSRLTEDHSLVETLVREGRITPDEADVHPQRNVLTRALGVEALVVVDAWLLTPCEGDRLLLCSDGLYNDLSESEVAAILDEGDDAEVAARRLTAEADAAGGRDNVTAVVVDLIDVDRPFQPLVDRFRRIATPTVDLDDVFHDPSSDTATVPLVPIAATPRQASDRTHDEDDPLGGDLEEASLLTEDRSTGDDGDDGAAAIDLAELDAALDRVDAGTLDDVSTDVDGSPQDSDPAAGQRAEGSREGSDGRSDRRRMTWRTPVFVLAVLLLFAGAFAVVVFAAGRGWFVGPADGSVAIYRGTPGGFLWVHPELEQVSEVELSALTARDRSDVEEKQDFPSLALAQRYVINLEGRTTTTTTTTTSTTTTTTTAVPAPVVPPPPPPATPETPAGPVGPAPQPPA